MTPSKKNSGAKIMASQKPNGSIRRIWPVVITGKPTKGIRMAGDSLMLSFKCLTCALNAGRSRIVPFQITLTIKLAKTCSMRSSISKGITFLLGRERECTKVRTASDSRDIA